MPPELDMAHEHHAGCRGAAAAGCAGCEAARADELAAHAAALRRECQRLEDERARLGWELQRLRSEGARDPHALMPAIHAYVAETIRAGKLRDCVRRWLAGVSFQDPGQRDWERH